jgi:hypothetical protein
MCRKISVLCRDKLPNDDAYADRIMSCDLLHNIGVNNEQQNVS